MIPKLVEPAGCLRLLKLPDRIFTSLHEAMFLHFLLVLCLPFVVSSLFNIQILIILLWHWMKPKGLYLSFKLISTNTREIRVNFPCVFRARYAP